MTAPLALGRTARKALAMIAKHGPVTLSHGVRYAEITPYGIRVMQSTNYLIRSSGMVEWAGGNYSRWHVRITEYGRECLRRGSRDPSRHIVFIDSYGPRDDAALLTDANRWYSADQIEEMNG